MYVTKKEKDFMEQPWGNPKIHYTKFWDQKSEFWLLISGFCSITFKMAPRAPPYPLTSVQGYAYYTKKQTTFINKNSEIKSQNSDF